MTEAQHYEFMRAVYYHKLNVFYNAYLKCGEYRLGSAGVIARVEIEDYRIKYSRTLVDERFKAQYMDTTPDNVWRCRTCIKQKNCDIIRENKEEFCALWKSE
ncbi:MAG: hypothetical protein IJP79_07285 [Paludibacteraceae bacterium]|nr:hypothetical protein [Paludibacteraceae bacterium]MBQ6963487.1 hypothetical protein [Paludibacteraceae bacterium]MBQ7662499.1 hypothetical protein [Prevotella sp.]MBQ7748276.1 hypothetical protein [Paludibacteraceae bacterium]